MRHEIEQPLNRSRAAMAHGATAQMDARTRRDDADAELDRLEDAIDDARGHGVHAAASAYFEATRSRARKDQHAWEDAQQRYRAASGDAV